MDTPKLKKRRIILAFGVAIAADSLQFLLTAITATGFLAVPAEFVDVVIDFIVMIISSMLIGFHWMLLPSLFIEVIPGLDLLPTWTASVAYVIWRRKKLETAPIVERDITPRPLRALNPPPSAAGPAAPPGILPP